MNQLHIVTVGISLLTNYARTHDQPLEKAARLHKQLADFLKADPRTACSEIASLDARTGLLRRKVKSLGVTLVYTATAGKEGSLAARLIGNFLKQRGVELAEVKLRDIAVPANPQADPVEAAQLAETGLIHLYDALDSHVRKMWKRFPLLDIEINATGGYKAEAAILYGLGCDLCLRVYYLHETYRVAITLPVCGVSDIPF